MEACAACYALTYVNYSEIAVSQLNGCRPDSHQVEASYISCAWLPLVQYRVHLYLWFKITSACVLHNLIM
jgi:hypothetical protein